MDVFMKKIERLAEMAADRSAPAPLDTAGVMERIRGLAIEDDANVLSLPLGFFAGGAAAAAAAAIGISIIAITAWSDLSGPFIAVNSLLDVMEAL